MEDDLGDIGKCFHVVDKGRHLPKPFVDRVGRLDPRVSSLPFQRFDQGGLFAADIGAAALLYLYIEGEIRSEDLLSEEIVLAGLLDGLLGPFDREGILAADVDVTLLGAHGIPGQDHGFQKLMGIPFQDESVLEGSGLPLVGVADDILRRPRLLSRPFPLEARGKTGASAAPKTRGRDFVDDPLGCDLFGKDLFQGPVPAGGQDFVDLLGVDLPSLVQNDPALFLSGAHVVEGLRPSAQFSRGVL